MIDAYFDRTPIIQPNPTPTATPIPTTATPIPSTPTATPAPPPKTETPFEDIAVAPALKRNYPDVYEKVEELPWVQDSVAGIEHDAIEWLYWLADARRSATVSLLALPWLQDSITETEGRAPA